MPTLTVGVTAGVVAPRRASAHAPVIASQVASAAQRTYRQRPDRNRRAWRVCCGASAAITRASTTASASQSPRHPVTSTNTVPDEAPSRGSTPKENGTATRPAPRPSASSCAGRAAPPGPSSTTRTRTRSMTPDGPQGMSLSTDTRSEVAGVVHRSEASATHHQSPLRIRGTAPWCRSQGPRFRSRRRRRRPRSRRPRRRRSPSRTTSAP